MKHEIQKLLTHHYNEILRLKKNNGFSEYDTKHRFELISFLDNEVKEFKTILNEIE